MINLSGKIYGRWLVLNKDSQRKYYYICQCSCGGIKSVYSSNLKKGISKSCGCLRLEYLVKRLATHGMSKTNIHKTWQRILTRCRNRNIPNFKDYGARGITVCERWLKFENFYSDMGECPEGMSIERINNDKGYSPDNCRWATFVEQANNKRNNIILIIMGIKYTLPNAARRFEINHKKLRSRIQRGWEVHDAIFTP